MSVERRGRSLHLLPNHLHREYTVRALDAGVHVLCEKPMAVTEEECEAMIRAAERNTESS